MATHSSILAWLIPWTEKPVEEEPVDRGAYSPWGCKQSDTTKPLTPLQNFNKASILLELYF